MGYDSFGLPAEQYAIQTGQRPEDTTRVNIDGGVDEETKCGLPKADKIGFSFDGVVKSVLQILIITSTHNGFLSIQLLVQ
jgi:hypothetical protein